MFIAYYDESGDDGYPNYSSPLFVLTSLYLHYLSWRETYKNIIEFRQQLKTDFVIPVKLEMHTKHFLLNKKPFRNFDLSEDERILIIDLFCTLLSQLEIRIVNVVINKTSIQSSNYNVLDRALTYSIQRIENDLNRIDPAKKFLIITDEGRVGKMRYTARKIQKINFIPSKFNTTFYRQEIISLIEDPLPKNSKESYYIQLADMVAYIVYLYSTLKLKVGKLPNRLPNKINEDKIIEWMELLKGSFNLEASGSSKYGIVCYPK